MRHLVWSALASLLLVGFAPASVQADEARPHHHRASCPTADRAGSTTTAPNPARETYYRDDWRLGPGYLPRTGPVGRMLRDYRPQGDSASPYWFLGCYWQTNPQTGISGWWYPDNNGFVLRGGRPVEAAKTLRAGQLVDLFGSGNGNFLAPAGTPYDRRAIPPNNLDAYAAGAPALNYHLYQVTKPFTVQAGPIRPWFGQPGLGTQYMTGVSIPTLVGLQDLKQLN